MNWDNNGNPKDGIIEINKSWDIDHIIPVGSAKTEEELLKEKAQITDSIISSIADKIIEEESKSQVKSEIGTDEQILIGVKPK
jgi:hypothetical protein